MGKLAFHMCKIQGTDQLPGNHAADQRLCFHYTDSKIPLLSKSVISSLKQFSLVQHGLCGLTWLETH